MSHSAVQIAPEVLRQSQRAPRSCTSCASRKVKCDKAIPCASCVRRGEELYCARETVLVRGRVKTAQNITASPTYEDLLFQNQQLREQLGKSGHREVSQSLRTAGSCNDLVAHHTLEPTLIEAGTSLCSSVTALEDILLPARSASEQLVAYDRTWHSWVHYATEYPRFQAEHDAFMDTYEEDRSLYSADMPWIAVYLSVICASLLMISDEDVLALNLTRDAARNWYDGSMLCLHRAEFMRRPRLETVQAITILGMCYNHFGDGELNSHMWSAGIRVAQRLNMDRRGSNPNLSMSIHGQRRLWWTLVICEWLNLTDGPPQIDELDFDTPFPATGPETEDADTDPAHYHLFMALVARAHYRFRRTIRRGDLTRAEAVRHADIDLADVIIMLPNHLQPDTNDTNLQRLLDAKPWIQWQRFSITLVLLNLRMRMHSSLRVQWCENPEEYSWAQSISVKAAKEIIWISYNWDQPPAMRNQWALSFHVFGAACVLLNEQPEDSEGTSDDAWKTEIQMALHVLDGVASRNMVASQAAIAIRTKLEDSTAVV